MPTIIIAIAIIYTPQLARVVRANVLAQYGEDYVRAERVIGAGRFYILLKHIVREHRGPGAGVRHRHGRRRHHPGGLAVLPGRRRPGPRTVAGAT